MPGINIHTNKTPNVPQRSPRRGEIGCNRANPPFLNKGYTVTKGGEKLELKHVTIYSKYNLKPPTSDILQIFHLNKPIKSKKNKLGRKCGETDPFEETDIALVASHAITRDCTHCVQIIKNKQQ